MGNRNNKGRLSVKALLRGEQEQYGTVNDGATYALTLRHEPENDDFVVTLEVRDRNDLLARNVRAYGRGVDEARAHFSRVKAVLQSKLATPRERR